MSDTKITAVGSGDVAAISGQAAGSGGADVDMSALGMFLNADLVVQLIVVLLFLGSFWSWIIIINKYVGLNRIEARSDKFETSFWKSKDLDAWYEKIKAKANDPLARVFMAGMQEWTASRAENKTPSREERGAIRERVGQAMQVARNREVDLMENGLGFLATVGSTAPFIGLLGTVLGIMNSFQSIANEKSTNLVVVAPGIAEALFATAIGLFAAIPAVMAYNKFNNDIGRLTGTFEDFSTEFDTLLSRQFDKKE